MSKNRNAQPAQPRSEPQPAQPKPESVKSQPAPVESAPAPQPAPQPAQPQPAPVESAQPAEPAPAPAKPAKRLHGVNPEGSPVISAHAEGWEPAGIKISADLPAVVTPDGIPLSVFNADGKINGNTARWQVLHFGGLVPLSPLSRLNVTASAVPGYEGTVNVRLSLVEGTAPDSKAVHAYHMGLMWHAEVYGSQPAPAQPAQPAQPSAESAPAEPAPAPAEGSQPAQPAQPTQPSAEPAPLKSVDFARCLSTRKIPAKPAKPESVNEPAQPAQPEGVVIDSRMDVELALRRAIGLLIPDAEPQRSQRAQPAPAPVEVDITGADSMDALIARMRAAGIVLKGVTL